MIIFRNFSDSGPCYYEVRRVNYDWRCTCYEHKMINKMCKHIRTVINDEMFIENEIIEVPSLRSTIEAAQLAFYGYVPFWNKSNSSPWVTNA